VNYLVLQDYLETKRVAFPRFYFVAPADLLDILSKGSNPQLILRYCFYALLDSRNAGQHCHIWLLYVVYTCCHVAHSSNALPIVITQHCYDGSGMLYLISAVALQASAQVL